MHKSRSRSRTRKRTGAGWLTSLGATLAAAMLMAVLIQSESAALASTTPDATVQATQAPEAAARGQRRYRATRPVVVDRATGRARMPTVTEVEELVANLTTLTKRTTDDLVEKPTAAGGIEVDVAGGFAGVMLARPNTDGTFETRCVFTFEEGADFLGLVEEIQ